MVKHALFYMKNQLLRDSDWSSMAHSIELRLPFVDIKLFRGMLEIISSAYYPNKADLLETSKDFLPIDLKNRKKTGFSTPVYEWFTNDGFINNSKNWAKIVIDRF